MNAKPASMFAFSRPSCKTDARCCFRIRSPPIHPCIHPAGVAPPSGQLRRTRLRPRAGAARYLSKQLEGGEKRGRPAAGGFGSRKKWRYVPHSLFYGDPVHRAQRLTKVRTPSADQAFDVDDRAPPKPSLITVFAAQGLRPLRPTQLNGDGERGNSAHADRLDPMVETFTREAAQNVIDRSAAPFQGAISTALPFDTRAAVFSEPGLIRIVWHWRRDEFG